MKNPFPYIIMTGAIIWGLYSQMEARQERNLRSADLREFKELVNWIDSANTANSNLNIAFYKAEQAAKDEAIRAEVAILLNNAKARPHEYTATLIRIDSLSRIALDAKIIYLTDQLTQEDHLPRRYTHSPDGTAP